MNYVLKNDRLTVTVSSLGAEPISVKRGDCEYLWQGGGEYWGGKAPMLFPICGRLQDGKYFHRGTEYEMKLHGFLRSEELELVSSTDTELILVLHANERTRAAYPFEFTLTATYRLTGDRLDFTAVIQNESDESMPATFGGHPGFNVPFDGKGEFSDYRLEFSEPCTPDQIEIAPSGLQTGLRDAYPLQGNTVMPLSHDLFQIDGVFLSRMAPAVTLKSDLSERFVTLSYPDMPYLGIWHDAQTPAPYVCIEPWCGLPDFDGRSTELVEKAQMFHLLPHTSKTVGFSMIFG